MRVVDLIKSTDNTAFSFEILPPLKGTGIEKLYKTVDTLREFDPKYINITTHRSEYVYKELGNGLYQRTRQRRRPGTVAVAAALQNKYNITTSDHLTDFKFSKRTLRFYFHTVHIFQRSSLLRKQNGFAVMTNPFLKYIFYHIKLICKYRHDPSSRFQIQSILISITLILLIYPTNQIRKSQF